MKPEDMKKIVDFVKAKGDNKFGCSSKDNEMHHYLVLSRCPFDLGIECPELCRPIDKTPLEACKDIYLCHSCWLRSVQNWEENNKSD